jgi:hypothetical protein
MNTFDPAAYGPAIEELLRPERLPALAVDPPYQAMHAQLEALEYDEAFAPFAIRDRAMAAACQAGLWLFFDFLDEAHKISQDLHTPEGSYWHAIVHRREPDFDNARYWLRRLGSHPVFANLAGVAVKLGYKGTEKSWDPFAFVDHCEQVLNTGGSEEKICRQVQLAEWRLLFDYCHRRATGSGR